MMPSRTGRGRFDALQFPAYRLLFLGGLLTFLTMQVAGIARAWLAFDLSGTNTGLGGVMLAFGLSSIVAVPSGGVIADRFSRRRVLFGAGTLQTLTPALLGLATATGSTAYWMLLAASVVQGATISILAPARLSMIAAVVDREILTNAVFLSMSTIQFTRVFGPAAAGALIGVSYFGLAGVFFAAAACGALSLLFIAGLEEGPAPVVSGRSPLGDLIDGLRFVRSRPEIRHMLMVSILVVLVGFPYITFLPVIAEDVHGTGSSGFGLLTTVSAVGALVTTIVLANVARDRLGSFQYRAALVFGVSLAMFALMPNFNTALILIAIVGGASSAFQALNNSLVLTTVPVEYHGRIQSLLLLSFSGFAIAALPIGIFADRVGIEATVFGLGGGVVVVICLSKLVEPRGWSSAARL